MYDENVNVRIMIIKTSNHFGIVVRWITFFKTNNYVGIEEREQFGKVQKNKCKLIWISTCIFVCLKTQNVSI